MLTLETEPSPGEAQLRRLAQPVLDNAVVEYDVERFPFVPWVQERIRAAGYDGSDLRRLHERVPMQEIAPLQKHLISETSRPEFAELARQFVREVIRPIFDADLAVQRFKNLRIFVPDRPDMNIHFHNGLWYGHGPGETTVWMPLCETAGNASLQVVDLETSRRMSARALAERWSHEQMQAACLQEARAVSMCPGQALLFQQEGIHGNPPVNDTGSTRISFDFRVAVAGCELARKQVGGYFELCDWRRRPEEAVAEERDDRDVIGYVNNSTDHTKGIPIHLQRLMMKEYCETYRIRYTYEQLDIEVFGDTPILHHIVEHDRPDDVVLYSIFALPDRRAARESIIECALENGVCLHFANEDVRVRNREDADHVAALIGFASYRTLGPLV